MELVQEIYQILIDKEETCHRTCFSLQLDGTTLDNFAELKNVEGLKEGSVLKVVEGLHYDVHVYGGRSIGLRDRGLHSVDVLPMTAPPSQCLTIPDPFLPH